MEKSILLSKSVKYRDTKTEDKYVRALADAGYSAFVIETLSFEDINIDKLKECLENVAEYSAIILTSEYAAQLVCNVFNALNQNWNEETVIFVVGSSTGKCVKETLKLGLESELIFGEDCGNAGVLAEKICEQKDSFKLPVLFPCSEQRLNIIPQFLDTAGIKYKEVKCYRTCPHPSIATFISNYIERHSTVWAIVYFSPTCVQFLYPVGKEILGYANFANIQHYAIGPSTATELKKYGIHVTGVAQKPTTAHVINMLNNT